MDIYLMVNSSPNNQVSKSLSTAATLSGTLREETSIIDPVIKIEGDVSTYAFANYCYIPDFGRYYYINNIRSIRNNLFEISCHVDVLQTYSTGIRGNSALIRRQQDKWNLLINDGSVRTYADSHTLEYAFPNGFSARSIVLCVAGPQSIS